MDDKFINALKTSEQLTEAKLDEGLGQTIAKAAVQGAANAFNNSKIGKAINGAKSKINSLANQYDQNKSQQNIQKCVNIIATRLCTQAIIEQSGGDKSKMKQVAQTLTGMKIPQKVVQAALSKASENVKQGDNNGQK